MTHDDYSIIKEIVETVAPDASTRRKELLFAASVTLLASESHLPLDHSEIEQAVDAAEAIFAAVERRTEPQG